MARDIHELLMREKELEAERDNLLAAVGHEAHKFPTSGEAVDAAIAWIEDRRDEATAAMTDAHRLREALERVRDWGAEVAHAEGYVGVREFAARVLASDPKGSS